MSQALKPLEKHLAMSIRDRQRMAKKRLVQTTARDKPNRLPKIANHYGNSMRSSPKNLVGSRAYLIDDSSVNHQSKLSLEIADLEPRKLDRVTSIKTIISNLKEGSVAKSNLFPGSTHKHKYSQLITKMS